MGYRPRTIRQLLLWEYAKLISESATGERKNFKFVGHSYEKLIERKMNPSNILRENQKLFEAGEQCAYCGDDSALQWEHIIPSSAGGPNTIDNLVRACKKCNLAKGALDPYQWYSKSNIDGIPRLVLGKLLKLLYAAYEAEGVLDSEEYMNRYSIERVNLCRVFSMPAGGANNAFNPTFSPPFHSGENAG